MKHTIERRKFTPTHNKHTTKFYRTRLPRISQQNHLDTTLLTVLTAVPSQTVTHDHVLRTFVKCCVGERIKCNFLHNWLSGFDLSNEIFIGLKAFPKINIFHSNITVVLHLLYIYLLYSQILNIKSKVLYVEFCISLYFYKNLEMFISLHFYENLKMLKVQNLEFLIKLPDIQIIKKNILLK